MERITNRPFLQVCSRCYQDFLKNIGYRTKNCVPSSSSSSIISTRQFLSSSYSAFHRNNTPLSIFNTNVLKDNHFSKGHVQMTGLQSINIFRHFATDSPQNPNPSPLPPRKSGSKDNSDKSPITWKNLLVVSGVAGILLLGMKYVKGEKEEARRKAQNKKMGRAKLGGDWTLVDHHGKLRSSTEFRGQWLLIYFGFTNCPDICPEEIEKIVTVINKTDTDKDLPTIQPIVITVDPARDTPEALKEYCGEFSPRLLGFSGTEEQIGAATKAYRVYFSAGPKDEDNDYIVDHSIISYLISPEGEFVEYFGQNKKVEEIYSSIKLHILSYLKKKSK